MNKRDKSTKEFVADVSRTSEGLRSALFDELDCLRNGKSTPGKAGATANIAGRIISVVRLEMDYHRMSGKKGSIAPLALGGKTHAIGH